MFNQLFDFVSSDLLGDHLIFESCTLKRPLAQYPQGTHFDAANVDLVNGILSMEDVVEGESSVRGRYDITAILGDSRWKA